MRPRLLFAVHVLLQQQPLSVSALHQYNKYECCAALAQFWSFIVRLFRRSDNATPYRPTLRELLLFGLPQQ